MTDTQLTQYSTVTSTVIVTNSIAHKRDAVPAGLAVIAGRQVTVAPSSVPVYASACSGTAGYSSACSCIGVTGTTTTLPTPTTTVTVLSTITVSSTPTATCTGCGDPPPHFLLQAVYNASIPYSGLTIIQGAYYGNLDGGDQPHIFLNEYSSDGGTAFQGASPANPNLFVGPYIAKLPSGVQFGDIYFDSVPEGNTGAIFLTCSIAGGMLACEAGPGINILQQCPIYHENNVFIGSYVQTGCYVVAIKPVPLCVPLC